MNSPHIVVILESAPALIRNPVKSSIDWILDNGFAVSGITFRGYQGSSDRLLGCDRNLFKFGLKSEKKYNHFN